MAIRRQHRSAEEEETVIPVPNSPSQSVFMSRLWSNGQCCAQVSVSKGNCKLGHFRWYFYVESPRHYGKIRPLSTADASLSVEPLRLHPPPRFYHLGGIPIRDGISLFFPAPSQACTLHNIQYKPAYNFPSEKAWNFRSGFISRSILRFHVGMLWRRANGKLFSLEHSM